MPERSATADAAAAIGVNSANLRSLQLMAAQNSVLSGMQNGEWMADLQVIAAELADLIGDELDRGVSP